MEAQEKIYGDINTKTETDWNRAKEAIRFLSGFCIGVIRLLAIWGRQSISRSLSKIYKRWYTSRHKNADVLANVQEIIKPEPFAHKICKCSDCLAEHQLGRRKDVQKMGC